MWRYVQNKLFARVLKNSYSTIRTIWILQLFRMTTPISRSVFSKWKELRPATLLIWILHRSAITIHGWLCVGQYVLYWNQKHYYENNQEGSKYERCNSSFKFRIPICTYLIYLSGLLCFLAWIKLKKKWKLLSICLLVSENNYIAVATKKKTSLLTVAYSEHCQACKMERFRKIVNDRLPLSIFAKRSVLDVWQGSEYATEPLTVFAKSAS